MRLNLGSGPHYADGWTNVDKNDPPPGCKPPDIYASVFELETVESIRAVEDFYLGHLLEHIPWDDLPRLWSSIASVAVPGAAVMVVGPCLWRALDLRVPRELLQAIVADPTEWDGSGGTHAWTPTTETTLAAMEMGLEGVTAVPVEDVHPPDWPNPAPSALWQVAAIGLVP